MKEYIEHDLIRSHKIEKQLYQINIYDEVKDKNSLVVLPTGLGKTIIAILVLAYKLSLSKTCSFERVREISSYCWFAGFRTYCITWE